MSAFGGAALALSGGLLFAIGVALYGSRTIQIAAAAILLVLLFAAFGEWWFRGRRTQ